MKAFGVFEGGGAKGLAHIGALKAAEEENVQFIGVAGTSAGSIVAALVAAGYRADELYDPRNSDCLFSMDFHSFFDAGEWKRLNELMEEVTKRFRRCTKPAGFWWEATKFLWWNRCYLAILANTGGFLRTEEFEKWLDKKLQEKLSAQDTGQVFTGPEGTVAFRDVSIPLKIVAANSRKHSIEVYSNRRTPEASIAAAVGASASIPFIFAPRKIDSWRFVDGGVMSNFPAWVFDEERNGVPPLTPTFGFRLVSRTESAIEDTGTENKFNLVDHIRDVFYTSVFGDNSLETREVATLYEIPLAVQIGPLDFDIDKNTKDTVFNEATNDARSFFRHSYVGPRSEAEMERILEVAHKAICHEMKYHGHLRVNVMRPVSHDTIQVVYKFNMNDDEDFDDQMYFRRGSGACGQCWQNLDTIVCDLEDAQSTYQGQWKMDKRQQRLVRPHLKSLMCVPIFDPRRLKEEGQSDEATLQRAFLGVLNFDSDERILEHFQEDRTVRTAMECASLVAHKILRI